ncbi:MAG: PAS domain S-box protein [Lysobacter sp.]|nr:MAG: PAS domain S-box protein [Lysobacter sp.]
MAMQARALVPGRHVGEAMRGLQREGFEDIHRGHCKAACQAVRIRPADLKPLVTCVTVSTASMDVPAIPPSAAASTDATRPALSWPTPRGWMAFLVLALVYGALEFAAMRWSAAHRLGTAPVTLAAGVALGALLAGGPRLWPGILAGGLLAAAFTPMPPVRAAVLTVGASLLAAVLAQRMLVRTRFHRSLDAPRDFLLLGVAAAITALLPAMAGLLASAHPAFTVAGSAWDAWSYRYLGNVTGVLLAAPLILAWMHGRAPRSPGWWAQFVACLAVCFATATFVFLRHDARMYSFVAFCPLIWAALALHLRGATVACLVMAAVAFQGAMAGTGPFAGLDLHDRYVDLQVLIMVMTVATLVLAVVADERRAQKALMLSEARLRLALEASDTGLWKVDLRRGTMTFSPECAPITGLAARDVDGSRASAMRHVHPHDQPAVRAAFLQAVTDRTLFQAIFRLQRPGRDEIWLEARGRAVFDADGRPLAMLGSLTDISGRRRDEQRLAEQAHLLDLASDAILVRELDGRITYWNTGAIQLYGYPREEALGRIASDLLQTVFPEPLPRIRDSLLRTGRWQGELLHRCRDGTQLAVDARWVLNRDEQGKPLSVMQTHTDISARRHAQAAASFLAQLDHHVAQAVTADEVAVAGLQLLGAHLGLLRCTLSDIDLDQSRIRTMHEWTNGGARVSGTFDASEFFASTFGRCLLEGDVVAVADVRTDPLTAAFAHNYAPYGTVALAAASYVIEGRLAGTLTIADRRPRTWRADEIQLLREVVARLWPAIERARSVAALRESEARFRQMADTAPVMIWVTESDSSCSYVSRRWIEFTGRPPECELGFGWLDVIHADDRPEAFTVFERAAALQEPFSSEYRALRRDGHFRWLHATARPRFGAGSEFLGYIGAVMDVTERREAEEALRDADRRKDEFLATLAHELRNPLAPLRTGLHVLNLATDAEVTRRTRQMMDRQLGHMVRLIDDLLDVSRITSGKVVLQRERISVQDAARAAIESARPQLEAARHRLSVDLPAAPLWIDADATRIAQVLGNLLANAAKYTPDGGDIRLRAWEGEGIACIEVSDSGLGIPAEALDEVFGMFAQINRTLHRSQGGLGIGLSLSKRLVEMHGGTITAESAGLGLGSVFRVSLPLTFRAPVERIEHAVSPATPACQVLVVDDNVDAAESLAMMLRLDGHDVRVAFGAREALAVITDFTAQIAFLDIGMPGMNGYELARELRSRAAQAPAFLVAVSGWGGETDKRHAFEAGFDLHLTKPVGAMTVQKVMTEVCRRLAQPEVGADPMARVNGDVSGQDSPSP